MKMIICYKYCFKNIIKSKQFLWITCLFLFVIFSLNLIASLIIAINQNDPSAADLWIFNVLLTSLIFLLTSIIAIIYATEFLYYHKINGVKTIEIKNGLKPWQIFLTKISAIISINFILVLITATLVIITNLIIFNSNMYVIQLISINLYSQIFMMMFVMAICAIFASLNWHLIGQICSGILVGLISVFPLINATMYDFMDKKINSRSLDVDTRYEYQIYYNYFAQKIEKNTDLYELFSQFKVQCIDNVDLSFEQTATKEIDDFYSQFINEASTTMVKSGRLFDDINIFNELNKTYMQEQYYKEIAINHNQTCKVIENNELYNIFLKADLKKQNNMNNFLNEDSISLSKELIKYVKSLENEFKNNLNFNKYYKDLKNINEVIIEIINKGLFFSRMQSSLGDYYWLSHDLIDNFLKDEYKGDKLPLKEVLSKKFEIQTVSSGFRMYQNLLFLLIDFKDNTLEIGNNFQLPENIVVSKADKIHYYTSPFLWMEYLSMYGFVNHTYSNLEVIYDNYFWKTNNFVKINYEIIDENNISNGTKIKILSYENVLPNRFGMFLSMLIVQILLLSFAFLLYLFNFYK